MLLTGGRRRSRCSSRRRRRHVRTGAQQDRRSEGDGVRLLVQQLVQGGFATRLGQVVRERLVDRVQRVRVDGEITKAARFRHQ